MNFIEKALQGISGAWTLIVMGVFVATPAQALQPGTEIRCGSSAAWDGEEISIRNSIYGLQIFVFDNLERKNPELKGIRGFYFYSLEETFSEPNSRIFATRRKKESKFTIRLAMPPLDGPFPSHFASDVYIEKQTPTSKDINFKFECVEQWSKTHEPKH